MLSTNETVRYDRTAELFSKIQKILATAEPNEYALVTLDFDNFKYINDLFGYETGDNVLFTIAGIFYNHVNEDESFARVNADNFVFLLKAKNRNEFKARLARLCELKDVLSQYIPPHYSLVTSCGVYFVSDPNEKLSSIIDRSNYARKKVKGKHSSSVNYYDDKMDTELRRRKEITLNMKQALANNEFEMYLQPKIMLKTKELIGAEALVRWNSATSGIIYPDEFIPVLEQNGFITLIDYFMLEQACLFINDSARQNIPVLPISVNFSRVHIANEDFVERVGMIVESYNVNPSLIEIELTEGVFIRELPLLIEIVKQLKNIGFKVSIDDFGTAYSSISYLKDVPVDIIKIDKSFLNSSSRSEKGRLVIAKLIELIKSLRLLTVVEGVEEEEQVEFLQKLSCDIVQGYFYGRPMRADAYIEFVKSYGDKACDVTYGDRVKDKRSELTDNDGNFQMPREFEMDNWELFTIGQNIDMGLMKGLLNGDTTVQYVNKTALGYLGYTIREFRDICHNKISNFTHPDDVAILESNVAQLRETSQNVSFKTRAIRKDGKVITLQGRASSTIDNYGRQIGIYAFQDVTKEIEERTTWENSLRNKINELEALYSNLPGGVLYFIDDEELTLTFVNDGFCDLIGYSQQEILDNFDNKLVRMFSCREGKELARLLKDEKNIEVSLTNKDGEMVWLAVQGQLIKRDIGEQYCLVLVDITEQVNSRQALRISEQRYKSVMGQSDDIIYDWDISTDTVVFSEKFEEIFGLPRIVYNATNSTFFEKVHREDLDAFKNWVNDTYVGKAGAIVDVRFMTKNGYEWFNSKCTILTDENGTPLRAIGLFTNINQQRKDMDLLKTKSQQDQLTKLFNKTESSVRIAAELNNCLRANKVCSLMILDIDNFKGVNDNLGHQFGDTVLVDVACKIREVFDGDEIIGRFGGDEFVVFLPSTTVAMTTVKAEQIVCSLRNNYYGEDKKYKVSVSVGIAIAPTHCTTVAEAYKFADIALYDSKRKGKDCYTIYNELLKVNGTALSCDNNAIKRSISSHYKEDPIFNIFEMLYETKDIRATLSKILEILGQYFDVDRVYIFENDEEKKQTFNTYEWCASGISPEMESLQNIPTSDMAHFFSLYDDDGILCCNDFSILDELSRNTLERQGIKSLLHCGISQEGEFKGFIGFDVCKIHRIWRTDEVAMLAYVSRILSTFILKKQISRELWELYQNHVQILDNMHGFIYVIDPKTFETVYLNKEILAFEGVKVGQKCYEIAFGTESPCASCPAARLSDTNPIDWELKFYHRAEVMVKASASRVSWTGCPDAILVCCTEIQDPKDKDCRK